MLDRRFQTFEDREDRAASAGRVAALRDAMREARLDGFLVPRSDRYQNENVPPADERLAWLTGFTGSAGLAVILLDRAALFVDGRYTLQAQAQVDTSVIEVVTPGSKSTEAWFQANAPAQGRLGFDPWLHTVDAIEKLGKACASADATLVPVEENLVDRVWSDRPAAPMGAVTLHEMRFAGEDAGSKLGRLREQLTRQEAGGLVITDPHALAWLFNVRGCDVAHTPLPLGFGIVPREGRPKLYLEGRKLTNEVRHALDALADIREPTAFSAELAALAKGGRKLLLDEATAAYEVARIVREAGGTTDKGRDPIAQMRAVKNAVEIAGAREAHRRDGAAMVDFLAWLERATPNGRVTEIDAVERLEDFRRQAGLLKDVSFPTIAGSGPNGAIVHYRVTRATNRPLRPGELFLVDSGAQYEDGTTDVTRTVAIGSPTQEMRERFTAVLKGHIALARAVFPVGTTGAQLDPFARQHLWARGLDFDHGTGHGVGSYLSVHEGPARIAKSGNVALERGMILSNEPGYYKTGAYGIRIENLVLVIAADDVPGREKDLNAFETLTLVPFDRRLIAVDLMDPLEIAWVDAYHRRVGATLSPVVGAESETWLAAATRPLNRREA